MKKLLLLSLVFIVGKSFAATPLTAESIADVRLQVQTKLANDIAKVGLAQVVDKNIVDLEGAIAQLPTELSPSDVAQFKDPSVFFTAVSDAALKVVVPLDEVLLFETKHINLLTSAERARFIASLKALVQFLPTITDYLRDTRDVVIHFHGVNSPRVQEARDEFALLEQVVGVFKANVGLFEDATRLLDAPVPPATPAPGAHQPVAHITKQQMLQERKQKALQNAKEQLAKAKKAKNKKAIKRWQGVIKQLQKKQVKKPAGKKPAKSAQKKQVIKKKKSVSYN